MRWLPVWLWLIGGACIVMSLSGCATAQAHRPLMARPKAHSQEAQAFPTTSCSDVWTGPGAGGVWTAAADWSMGVVPSATDMACVPARVTVRLTRGGLRVGSLIDAGTLVATRGSLAVVDPGVVAEFATLTVHHGAAVRFAGRVEGGTLNDSGYVSLGKPRLVIGGVAHAQAFVACIPNYTPKNVVQECMRSSRRYGHPILGSGKASGPLADPAITPMAHEHAPLAAAVRPEPGFWDASSARACDPPAPTGTPQPGDHDHPAVRLAWRRFASEVNAIACHPERNTIRARRRLLQAMTAQACLFFDQHLPKSHPALVTDCQTQLRMTLQSAPLHTQIDNLEVAPDRAYGDAFGNVRFTFYDGAWRISEL